MTARLNYVRPSAVGPVLRGIRLPSSLARGLVWAPDLIGLSDPESGGRGTLDGTTLFGNTRARSFNGTTDRIDWPNVKDFGTVRVPSAFAGWIFPTDVAATRTIWVDSLNPASQSVQIRLLNDALEFTHATDAVPLRRISAAATITVNAWNHVGYSYTGGTLSTDATLYINGVEPSYQAGSNPTGNPRGGTGIWALGGRVEADTNNFAGRIQSPMVWERALAASEFATLARLPRLT